jgi:adenine-specific DNA-methyltransferase
MPTLHWLTRDDDLKAAGKAEYRLLTEDEKYSCGDTDNDNIIIQGDNLEALKALLPFYAGQVKCVYIDPPYNTGAAYDDNLEHTMWLSMMYPRLELLRELLAKDGSIWISIDDDEGHYMKVICDEIFGRNNFVANIIWQKKHTRANDAKWFSDNHDHILCYARHKETWRPNLLARNESSLDNYSNPDNDPRGVWASNPCHVKTPSENYIYPIKSPSGKSFLPPQGRSWMASQARMRELIADNRIWFGKNGDNAPRFKKFLTEVKDGFVPLTVWLRDEVGDNQEAKLEIKKIFPTSSFATPKPERLIQRMVTLATNHGDLVLDSFLGSGTTAAVAHKMGRRYIGIEMGKQAKTHCVSRLQKVIDGEQGGISKSVNWQGGGGFRFYTLGDPIFNEDGQIRDTIKFDQLAAHIWFYETKTPFGKSKAKSKTRSPFLGVHNNTAYALLYNGILHDSSINGGNVLTSKTLAVIRKNIGKVKYDKLVIYGEASRLGSVRLKESGIVFKQIPYDVRAR